MMRERRANGGFLVARRGVDRNDDGELNSLLDSSENIF